MDLNLSLSYQEQNDNKAIILTDTTSNYNATGDSIVAGGTPVNGVMYQIVSRATYDFTLIDASNNNPGTRFICAGIPSPIGAGDELIEVTGTPAEITEATLNVKITGVDQVEVNKGTIDLFAEFGPFTTQDDLVYTITSALLGDTPNTLLVDGLYELDYIITHQFNLAPVVTLLNVTILVYGQVKVATYEKLRQIPVHYMCVDGCPTAEISEADLCGAYLTGIENSAYIAKTEELINMLIVLDNIIKNGSNITW
jgi:hypothetical protein